MRMRANDSHNIVSSLKSCIKAQNPRRGYELHSVIVEDGLLEIDPFLHNVLVDMYCKFGLLQNAEKVFHNIEQPDSVSWNSLLGGYAKHSHPNEALAYFEQMQIEGIHADAVTYVCGLKACASIGADKKGRGIHAKLSVEDLINDNVFVGNALLDMYAKCGLVMQVQSVFDELCIRDIISWNVLISAFAKNHEPEKAIICFERMVLEGLDPNIITFVCYLEACSSILDNAKGKKIHYLIHWNQLLGENLTAGIALVDMYAKCDDLVRAHGVFNLLPEHNIMSWNIIISSYVRNGFGSQALSCFQQMLQEGITANYITSICILKACTVTGAINIGMEMHCEVCRKGWLHKNLPVANVLIDMYAKFGLFSKAREVFDLLPVRDVVSWTALIAGYVTCNCFPEAMNCFQQMQSDGISPNEVSFLCSLKACTSTRDIVKGKEIHAEISRKGLFEINLALGNALLNMYLKCGFLKRGQGIFDSLPVHDMVSWTSLIEGYVEQNNYWIALNSFYQMEMHGISPNAITYVYVLQVCGWVQERDNGQKIHSDILKKGLLDERSSIGNAVINMYVKFGLLDEAHEVFNSLVLKDVISWTNLISGYVHHERPEDALEYYEHMQLKGVNPNTVTFLFVLKACSIMRDLCRGVQLHAQLVMQGVLETDVTLGNALIDMYGKVGSCKLSEKVFNQLPARDTISWNTLMSGYVKHRHAKEALECFQKMQIEGIHPDSVTYVCCLKACGALVAKNASSELHVEIMRRGVLVANIIVGNALIDMYARCGRIKTAREIFDMLPIQDSTSWTTLITGYAHIGDQVNVFDMFGKMRAAGKQLDPVTFTSVLKACNQLCLLDKGQLYYKLILNDTGSFPSIEHQTSMMALLCKVGHLDLVNAMMNNLHVHSDVGLSHVLLDMCTKWGNAKLGFEVFENMMQLGGPDATSYVRLCRVYVNAD